MSAELAKCIVGNSLQQSNQQQLSFYFWSCQLTGASPKYRWEPERSYTAGIGKREHPKRCHCYDNGEKMDKPKLDENCGKNEKQQVQDEAENGDAAVDADFMQHVLKVNACILGPKAAGVHLIAVRTRCYRQTEPDTCPIVCIDPDSQRTVSLGYEFVLDSQNEVTFELTEGAGPVWLTGLHQVRVHDPDGDGEGEADKAEKDEEVDSNVDDGGESDDFNVIDDSSRFRLAGVKIDEFDEDEEMSDADPDEDEELGDGDGDDSEDADVGTKARKKTNSATGKRSPITTAQLRRRKRRRLARGDSDEEEEEDEEEDEGEGDDESTDV